MTFYEAHRSTQAWFEYAEPGLLTNRTIRNFLSSYKTDSWPDIVKLTLLYGIVTLRKHVGGLEQIPLEKIRTLVRQMEAAHCIEEKLPPIHEKMKDLKGDVQEILEAFDTPTNTAARAKNNCVNPTDPTQKNAEAPKESQPAVRELLSSKTHLCGSGDLSRLVGRWKSRGEVRACECQRSKQVERRVWVFDSLGFV